MNQILNENSLSLILLFWPFITFAIVWLDTIPASNPGFRISLLHLIIGLSIAFIPFFNFVMAIVGFILAFAISILKFYESCKASKINIDRLKKLLVWLDDFTLFPRK